MTQDDIIRIAREADLVTWGFESLAWEPVASMEAIERFAQLVAAAEREACANVCKEIWKDKMFDANTAGTVAWVSQAIEKAIRARGQQ